MWIVGDDMGRIRAYARVNRRIASHEVDVEPKLVPVVGKGLVHVGNCQHRLHTVEFVRSQLASGHDETSSAVRAARAHGRKRQRRVGRHAHGHRSVGKYASRPGFLCSAPLIVQ